MKKIYLFFLLAAIWLPVQAQEKVIYADGNNLKNEITRLFKRADLAYNEWEKSLLSSPVLPQESVSSSQKQFVSKNNFSRPFGAKQAVSQRMDRVMADITSQTIQEASKQAAKAALGKKWQVAFMATDFLPSTALLRLQNKVEDGSLARASFLVWEKLEEPEGEGLSLWEQLDLIDQQKIRGTLYVIYPTVEGAVTEKVRFECTPQVGELLDLLFQNMNLHSDQFYTAVILSAHGDGDGMFDRKATFSYEISEVLSKIEEVGLQVDVLNLVACRMGSLLTMYQLVKSDKINYAIVSSDDAVTGVLKRISHLLRFLRGTPRNAVISSVTHNPSMPPVGQANELGYDLQALKEPLMQWIEQYAAMIKHGPEGMQHELFDLTDSEKRYLLDDFIKQQMNYVRSHLDIHDPINKAFMQSSGHLLQALAKSKMAQWCLNDSKCTNGIYVRTGDILALCAKYDIYWA